MIKIGTSGYYFKDWYSNFYPEKLKSSSFFSYYSDYFDTVEINSSYYRMPVKENVKKLTVSAPKNFTFFYKLFKDFTHTRTAEPGGSIYREFYEN